METQLLTNKRYILAAIHHKPHIVGLLQPELYADDSLMMALIMISPFHIILASERIRDNKAIVLSTLDNYISNHNTILNNGILTIFKYLSKRLQDDYDITRIVVSVNGSALKHASRRLQDDLSIAYIAIESCNRTYKYASDRIKDNIDFVLYATTLDASTFVNASDRIKGDRTTILYILSSIPNTITIYKNISSTLKNDRGILLILIHTNNKCSNILRHCKNNLQHDREIKWLAYTNNKITKSYLNSQLRYDFNI